MTGVMRHSFKLAVVCVLSAQAVFSLLSSTAIAAGRPPKATPIKPRALTISAYQTNRPDQKISNGSYTNIRQITLSWNEIAGATNYNYQLSFNGTSLDSGLFTNLQPRQLSLELNSGNGDYLLEVIATDMLNQQIAIGTYNLKLDQTLPAVSINAPRAGTVVTGKLRFVVQAYNNNAIKIVDDLTNVTAVLKNNASQISYMYQLADDGNGGFILGIDTAKLEDGVYAVSVKYVDRAGNTGYYNQNLNVDRFSINIVNIK